jgi:iron complex outermembrane recepter protein
MRLRSMWFLAVMAPLSLHGGPAQAQPSATPPTPPASSGAPPASAPEAAPAQPATPAVPATPATPAAPAAPGGPVIYSPPVYVVPPVIVHQPVVVVPAAPGTAAPTATAAPAAAAAIAAPAAPAAPIIASPATADPMALTDSQLAALSEDATVPESSVIYVGAARNRNLESRLSTTVTRSALLGSGLTNLGEVLQRLPSQGNGINARANNGGDGTTRLNLRGLGAARTTVAINGRSVAPSGTGADSSYDLGLIPLAMVERVEVLKDGDSASFGSGTIGGVANIITRKLNGSEASLYTGSSSRGDGNTTDASIATGVSSADGHITFAASYRRQESVFAGDRAWSESDEEFDYELREVLRNGSVATPEGFLDTYRVDRDLDGFPDGEPIDLCGREPFGDPIQFCTRDGAFGWRPFVFPDDLYNFQPENYLITPSERVSTFAAGEHRLSPGMRGFFEASYTRSETDQRLAPEPFSAARAPISAFSVYNPLGVGVHGYNRRLVEFGPRTSKQEVDAFRLVAGLKGELDTGRLDGWSWELSYNLGRSSATQTSDGNLNLDRMAKALGPSFFDGNGVARCGTPFAVIQGCVPLNLLAGASANAITPEMAAYVKHRGVATGFNQHQTALASLSGKLGESLDLTVSASHRRESGGFTPDSLSASGGTTANPGAAIAGAVDASEVWAEASFAPLAKLLQVDAAARAYRFESGGEGVSWRLSASLRPFSGVAFRASTARAFRAPSISSLFAGTADSFPGAIDPCDTTPPGRPPGSPPIVLPPDVAAECARQGVPANASFRTSQQRAIVGGNPNVEAETADVVSAGVILQPRPGLTLSADYFRTEVKDVIQSLGANAILAACFQRGDRSACDRIHRNPALGGRIDFIDDTVSNSGGNTTAGFDLAARYEHAQGKSRFSHLAEATLLDTFQIDNTLRIFEAKGNYDFGLFPELKLNLTSQWDYENVGFGANLRFFSSFDECQNLDCNGLEEPVPSPGIASGDVGAKAGTTDEEGPRREVESNTTVDLFGNYKMKNRGGTMTLSVGVNNVFDQDPPTIYDGFYADSDPDYDYMGRFFYARVTQQF